MTARDIMRPGTETLSPDCTVGEAVRRFGETKCDAFPVVDATGILVGTVNVWRVLRHVLPTYIVSGALTSVRFSPDLDLFHERLAAVRDEPVTVIMNRNPPQVRADQPVLECAAQLFHGQKTIHLLPVVDKSHRLVGTIVPFDLIKGIA